MRGLGAWTLTAALLACGNAEAQMDRAAEVQGGSGGGRMRVQISPRHQATLSAELPAKIAKLDLREGDAFKAGQVLVEFDCDVFRAQLAKAEAAAEAAREAVRVNRRLSELNAISKLEAEQSEAKLKETEAEAGAMAVTVGKCSLAAPYAGRVAKVHVDAHQYVTQGKPLLDVYDHGRLEVKLIVPSRWLSWLSAGTRFTIRVDDLNRSYGATVSRIGARVDPITQTVAIIGEVQGHGNELLPGMSGWAAFRGGS